MTKKKNDIAITDGDIKLKWRLSDKPTLKDVTVMLEKEIITKEEAKQMLFSEVNRDEQVKALEEQVEFLKDIIDRLSKQPANQVWHYVQTYTPRINWHNVGYMTPSVLGSSVNNLALSEIASDSGNISYKLNGNSFGTGTINAPSSVRYS